MINASWYKKLRKQYKLSVKLQRGMLRTMRLRMSAAPDQRMIAMQDKRRKAAETRQRRKAHQKRGR